MKQFIIGATFIGIFLFGCKAHAITIRYALIVGNNHGMDTDHSRPFHPLQHAQREAAVLKKTLVEYSNFDPSSKRTRLLVGSTRAEVKTALRALALQKKLDEKAFGGIDSMFLFYFTGHGVDGRLLLADGALTAAEVGAIFSDFDADFSIGVFDACFAGGLDAGVLTSKGIHAAPGLNLFREMPEEVLSAEGRIWYVSSSQQQESYEDKQLGGVFTHFFIEAVRMAQPDGPGITLDSIWRYAQSRTVEFTASRKRLQVPEQFINRFRSSAPVYFSFPTMRSSTLVLSPALEGKFALAYADGSLTEVFEKKKGIQQKLAVYPGKARVILVDNQKAVSIRSVSLKPKASLLLTTMQDSVPGPSVGEQSQVLFKKGLGEVTAVGTEPGVSLLGGVAYGFSLADENLLYARHGFRVPLRMDIGRALIGIGFQYGYDKRTYPTWTHQLYEVGGNLSVGAGIDFSKLRFGFGADLQLLYQKQRYENGERRDSARIRPSAMFTMLFPRRGSVQGEIFVNAGAEYAPGVGAKTEHYWQFSATFGAALYYRLY